MKFSTGGHLFFAIDTKSLFIYNAYTLVLKKKVKLAMVSDIQL